MVSDLKVAKKYAQVANNATKRNPRFAMTLTKVRRLLNTKRCYYTGREFIEEDAQHHLTFERINNDIGYTDSNVVACTTQVNALRANLSVEELKRMVNKIDNHK